MSTIESLNYLNSDPKSKVHASIHYGTAFKIMCLRELKIAWNQPMSVLEPMCFFLLVLLLFPFSLGTSPKLLSQVAPGALWIAALLASLLSLEKVFKTEHQDGALEQLLLTPYAMSYLMLAKVATHWLITAGPLLLVTPFIAYLLTVELSYLPILMLTLLLGTPIFTFMGAIGAALTLGLRKGGLLVSLLIVPFYIPVLVFAISAIDAVRLGLDYTGHLAILAAMLMACLTFAPFVISASIKVSLN